MIEKIKEAIADDSLILFVGAGMSIPLGIPNWNNLIIKILEELYKEYGDKSLVNFKHNIDLLESNSISVFDVLQQIEDRGHRPEAEKILYSVINKVEYPEDKLERHKKLWQISDKIITTNYDTALEAVLPKGIKPYTHDNQFQQKLGIKGNPFLYKMHGDISDPTKCILFESDYRKSYVEENAATQSLRSFLQTKTILFLGFSMEDPFIKDQLDFLNKIYKGHNNTHYIVTNRTTNLDGVKDVPVEDWEESFDTLLDELIEAKKEHSKGNLVKTTNEKEDVDISKIEDIVLLEKMFDEKKEEFDEEEDHLKKKVDKELRVIKDRMIELRTQQFNLDFKIPDHDQNELEHLFDTIYNSEIISDLTKQKISKIKDVNEKAYQWYHRSVIVSALACSLVNHRKIDITKIDLLIDFVNESEPKVWQKAITYLFIVLNFLGNRWIRHKKKLESKIERLKLNPEIQESLKKIIYFMQIGLQRKSVLGKYIFENDYFIDNPFNYFLPFFKENPSVDKLYDNENIEDIEGFIEFLYDIPLPDSFKYLVCNEENIIVEKKSHNQINEGKLQDSLSVFTMHIAFEPYLNYASEFLNFYENHPDINQSINEKGAIVEVKNLKNYLLNAIEHHRALARQFMMEELWGRAITHYEQLLTIEENDISALLDLVLCYEKNDKNIDKSLKKRLSIESLNPEDHNNLFKIGILYHKKKKYKTSIKYLDKSIKLNNQIGRYFHQRGVVKGDLKYYVESIKDFDIAIQLENDIAGYYYNRSISKHRLKKYSEALLDNNKAIELDDKEAMFFDRRAEIKFDSKKYSEALLDNDKAIDLDNNNISYYLNRAMTKSGLEDYEGVVGDCDRALGIDNERIDIYSNKANALRRLNKIDEAFKVIDIALKLNDTDGFLYGTKSTIYESLGNTEKFYELLEKSFHLKAKASWLDDDIKEKYKNEKRFQDLLEKYDQALEEE
ncbi:SIR2 family protein [uncultured Dokdonia sp.]|uniref:SIR2 family protein n=1 Tax=uncultured Dokdonia sp. TaxID=575653 RepID=UPI00260B5323|nr:SIR2 family protein [uncultured Dokdonia sp.]